MSEKRKKKLAPRGFASLMILLGFGIGVFFANQFSSSSPPTILASPPPVKVVPSPIPLISLLPATQLDPTTQQQVQTYLNRLVQKGYIQHSQGVWIQTDKMVLASYQGTTPLPAASLTKIATTLGALEKFGPDHTFVTTIEASGSLNAGVLSGDLIIRGGQDPFFVWEDAIALGNLLNQLGIRTVTGRLLIQGSFYMNFQTDPEISGNLLKSGINANQWPQAALAQFQTLPTGTPRPQVLIQGIVQVVSPETDPGEPLLIYQYHSLPMIDLLKKMNRFSNNTMAEMLAKSVGGVNKVMENVISTTRIPKAEIQLINGSGLGTENRLSPRAATVLFQAIQEKLDPEGLTVADAFEIVGVDTGVLEKRVLPPRLIAKSGTLNQVSSLAGVLSTQQKGSIWFAIMNGTSDLEGARIEQGSLLNSLAVQWQVPPALPEHLAPNYVLDPSRTVKQIQR